MPEQILRDVRVAGDTLYSDGGASAAFRFLEVHNELCGLLGGAHHVRK